MKWGKKKDITSITFIFQDDNFVLSAIFCAIEENNLEGLDKLLSMANIDVNQAGITIFLKNFVKRYLAMSFSAGSELN